MEEQPHLQGGELKIGALLMWMFGFGTNEGVKTVWNRHYTNIPVEIWVQFSNVYGFLGLSSDLRGVIINYTKVFD